MLALAFVVGCSGKAPTGAGSATGATGSLIVTVSGLDSTNSSGSLRQASGRTTTPPPNAAAEVKSIVVTHTGPDGGGTLTITNLTSPITASYDALPVGVYSFSAIAYDGSTPPVKLYASTNAPVTVVAGTVAAVNILLQQVVPGGTVTTTAPVITAISISNAAPVAGSTVSLTASVTAPVPTSQLTFAWTSSCNVSEANTPGDSFSSSSSLSTNFTSYCAGVETITFTVTETSAAGGLSVSGSVAVTYTGEGAAFGLSLHQFPDILTLTSGGNTQPSFGGTLGLTATIDDYVTNDTPTIAWSDNCNGSWQNGNTLTPTWTAPAVVPTGTTPPVACKLTLSVTDGLGGANSGWLIVNVGEPLLTVPPAAPTGVTASAASQTASAALEWVTISWPPVAGAASYNLYWSAQSGVTPATGTRIGGVTSPYVQTGLANGGTYYYVVTAVNAAGESAPSLQVSAFPVTAASAPTGVAVLPDNQQITISWAAVTGATTYNLYWSTTPGVTPASGTQITGVTSPYVQTGLINGTTYYYVVTAVNGNAESAASSQVSTLPDPPGTVTQFPIPTYNPLSLHIIAGPDGNLWFTESLGNKIGRITPSGVITEFAASAGAITVGPDGNLWFTSGSNIGRITPSGTITIFPVPSSYGDTWGIAAGPDGNMWFTQWAGDGTNMNIARISTSGTDYQPFAIPTPNSAPYGITAGSDGALWFVETAPSANKIGRITTTGTITEFPVPTNNPQSGSDFQGEITTGPDGNIWFVGSSFSIPGDAIYRITTEGVISEFDLPYGVFLGPIIAGPDGNMWFILDNELGRIATSGELLPAIPFTVFPPNSGYNLNNIAFGADGNVWGTEGAEPTLTCPACGQNIDRIAYGGYSLTVPAAPTGVAAAGGFGQVTISWPIATLATSYNLYWSTTPGVTPASGTRITGATSPYVQTGLPEGTTYYYVLTGVNDAGESPPSSQVSAAAQLPPSAPTAVTILPGNQQITISGFAVTGATSYNLYWSTTSGVTPANGTQIPVANSANPQYTQTGLTNGITYYYVVTALNAAGESLPSQQLSTEPDPAGSLTAFAETDGLYSIIWGPDGNLWFSEPNCYVIGQITPSGTVTNFPVPSAYGNPWSLAVGPDGNIWFTQWAGSGTNMNIARISTSGTNYQHFAIPTIDAQPYGITAGPDGRLWFTEYQGNKIGAITTDGTITEYSTGLSSNSHPVSITSYWWLWFTESGTGKIGQISTDGVIKEFPVPTINAEPNIITEGPDGDLWFTETAAGKIGHFGPWVVSITGITEFPLPNSAVQPVGITAGADGNVWFTEGAGYNIGQILTYSPNTVTEFAIGAPPNNPGAQWITAGPDGNLWFTESTTPNVVRLTP